MNRHHAMRTLTVTLTTAVLCVFVGRTAAQVPEPVTYRYTYTYDDARRLTGVEVEDYLTLTYAYDAAGNRTASTATPGSGVDVESAPVDVPTEVALYTGYPNPFNPSTQIRFDLPETGNVRIDVFDATGRLVSTLVDADHEPGRHTVVWDTRSTGAPLSSGAYFVRLRALDRVEVRSVILVK